MDKYNFRSYYQGPPLLSGLSVLFTLDKRVSAKFISFEKTRLKSGGDLFSLMGVEINVKQQGSGTFVVDVVIPGILCAVHVVPEK